MAPKAEELTNNPGARAQDRLESWKAIASYLGRSERTVRRWETREGLPVHRHQHDTGSSVYAFCSELDRWLAGRTADARSPAQADAWQPPATVRAAPASRAEDSPSEPRQPTRQPAASTLLRRAAAAPRLTAAVVMAAAALTFAAVLTLSESTAVDPVFVHERPATRAAAEVVMLSVHPRSEAPAAAARRVYLERLLTRTDVSGVGVRQMSAERISALRRAMRLDPSERLDLDSAHALARRDGTVDVLLATAVNSERGQATVSLIFVDAQRAPVTLTRALDVSGSGDNALHDLAQEVLREITSAPLAPRRPHPLLTTGSDDAHRCYVIALALLHDGRPDAARALLDGALLHDGDFAMAHAQLAWALADIDGHFKRARVHAERALQSAVGVSASERLFVEATMSAARGQALDGLHRLEALTALNPGHEAGWWRGLAICQQIRMTHAQPSCAPWANGLAALKPAHLGHQLVAVREAALADPTAAARTLAQPIAAPLTSRAATSEPDLAVSLALLPAQLRWAARDVQGALAALDAAAGYFETWPRAAAERLAEGLGRQYLALGRSALAGRWFDRLGDRALAHELKALVLLDTADTTDVVKAHLERGSGYRYPETLAMLARRSARRVDDNDATMPGLATLLRALPALRNGDGEGAVQALTPLVAARRPLGDALYFIAADLLADAYVLLQRPSQAAQVLEQTSRERTRAAFSGAGQQFLRCQLRLAELYRALGRVRDARSIENRIAQDLALADAGHPLRRRIDPET